jgi:hypothetical protein
VDAFSRLLNFFLQEFDTEERAEFPRLSRIPDSRVAPRLEYYKSLGEGDRRLFRECCGHTACACYGFVADVPAIDHTRHPFFERWSAAGGRRFSGLTRSVPLLRAAVQQYKLDAHRGVPSCISEDEFKLASAVRSVKATELRKRVRAALKSLGYSKIDDLGYYRCRNDGREFLVHVDYGGSSAQLRYCVAMPEFSQVHQLSQFCFERVLGFGFGDWDYIVEENVDDVMALFADVVRYCVDLPERIREEVSYEKT